MSGFISAGTEMHNSAQSGSIWSSLLCPQWSQQVSVALTMLGQVGSLPLCVLNFGDLVDLHTMSNRPSTHSLPALPGGRLHSKQTAAEIAIMLPASTHSPEPSHIQLLIFLLLNMILVVTPESSGKKKEDTYVCMTTTYIVW